MPGAGRPDPADAHDLGAPPLRCRVQPCAGDLLEQVWDEHADPFTNTVTVTIGRLRRKLGDPPVIKTTPGEGYRISSDPLTGR